MKVPLKKRSPGIDSARRTHSSSATLVATSGLSSLSFDVALSRPQVTDNADILHRLLHRMVVGLVAPA